MRYAILSAHCAAEVTTRCAECFCGAETKAALQAQGGCGKRAGFAISVEELRELVEHMHIHDVGHSSIRGMIDRFGYQGYIDEDGLLTMVHHTLVRVVCFPSAVLPVEETLRCSGLFRSAGSRRRLLCNVLSRPDVGICAVARRWRVF